MRTMYKLIVILGAGALLVGVPACHQPNHETARQEAQQQWDQVRSSVKLQLTRQQFDSRNFGDAAASCTEVIALNPKQVEAYVIRARALLELGETQEAAQTIQLARQAGLWCADFAYTLGVLAETRHELPEALEHYREARTLAGGEVDFIEAEAECLVALGREQEALTLVDEHAPRFAEDATLVTLGAHITALLGDEAEATRRYQLAWRIVPDSRLIPREYGLLLVRAGRYAEAVNALSGLVDAADSEDEVTPAVRRALAVCYLELGDPDRALKIMGDYADRHPGDTRAQVLCAKAAIGTHDMFSARRSLETAQQRAPHHPEVLLVRAVIQWRGKDYEGASTSLREVLSQRPEDLEAHCLLAEVSAAAGDFANAQMHFARALRLDPDCVWARTGLKNLVQKQPTTQLGVQRSRS